MTPATAPAALRLIVALLELSQHVLPAIRHQVAGFHYALVLHAR